MPVKPWNSDTGRVEPNANQDVFLAYFEEVLWLSRRNAQPSTNVVVAEMEAQSIIPYIAFCMLILQYF